MSAAGVPSRRLFFALLPAARARAALHELAQRPRGARARRVSAADLHLTLLFLGQVGEERLPQLRAAAERVRAAPCPVTLARLERWRGGLLCASGAVTAPLQALHAQLLGLVRDAGISVDARALRAHVTLARGLSRGEPPEADLLAPIRWRSRAFCLMESRARPDGGRYTTIGRWPLDSAKDDAAQHHSAAKGA